MTLNGPTLHLELVMRSWARNVGRHVFCVEPAAKTFISSAKLNCAFHQAAAFGGAFQNSQLLHAWSGSWCWPWYGTRIGTAVMIERETRSSHNNICQTVCCWRCSTENTLDWLMWWCPFNAIKIRPIHHKYKATVQQNLSNKTNNWDVDAVRFMLGNSSAFRFTMLHVAVKKTIQTAIWNRTFFVMWLMMFPFTKFGMKPYAHVG